MYIAHDPLGLPTDTMHSHGLRETPSEILRIDNNPGDRFGETQLDNGPVDMAGLPRPSQLPAAEPGCTMLSSEASEPTRASVR